MGDMVYRNAIGFHFIYSTSSSDLLPTAYFNLDNAFPHGIVNLIETHVNNHSWRDLKSMFHSIVHFLHHSPLYMIIVVLPDVQALMVI